MNARLKKLAGGRIRRCRAAMARGGLDVLIVVNPADVRYLTGFSGDDSVLVLAPGRKVLVTDTRFVEQAREDCPGLKVFLRKSDVPDAVGEILDGLKRLAKQTRKIGIESDHVSLRHYQAYRRVLGKSLKGVKPLVAPLRMCKDSYELSQIRKAVKIAEAGMRGLHKWWKIGMSERELAARLEFEMYQLGSERTGFDSIVAVGGHAAMPHAVPGSRRWQMNQSLLIDWGAKVSGYRSDLTRCYVAGKIRPAFADAYRWLLDAQMAAIDEVRAGATLKQVDLAARNRLIHCPYPIYGHGTGHGIGLDIHEQPFLRQKGSEQLQEGMVITIEPGIYVPGRFGLRIEDDVEVTSRGHRVLSSIAKDLESCVIG
ncbi:MAG: aminopeptidase P family protein [Planctomycetes bacterium]|nr:aminopeptidase P family protein [Planctomycetota bacterium]